MFIVSMGSPHSGIRLAGPFVNQEAAWDFADDLPDQSCKSEVVELESTGATRFPAIATIEKAYMLEAIVQLQVALGTLCAEWCITEADLLEDHPEVLEAGRFSDEVLARAKGKS